MLNRLPTHTPGLGAMLDDLGRPAPHAIAKALGVTTTTAQRWIKADRAPRAVMLALFYVSRWGAQWVDADTYNACQLHAQGAAALRRENDRLNRTIRHLMLIGHFGAANDPAPVAFDGLSIEPASTPRPRQNPQAEPVTPRAFVLAGHLEKVPAFPSRP